MIADVEVEQAVRSDGPAAGTRVVRLTSGLMCVDVLPDRGLDLGQVRAAGIPLAYVSGAGFPRWRNDSDGGWLRAFGGGMLATCGLRNVGPPSEGHPMHGRIGSLPAEIRRIEAGPEGAVVEGVVREAGLFEEELELHRRIEVPSGARLVRITDRIENRGSSPTELMTLYHVNFGAPLIAAGTRLSTSATAVRPRDPDAAAGLDHWDSFPTPSAPYPEQVFLHDLPEAQPVEATITAPTGLGVALRWDSAELPGLVQWRVADPGRTVLGIEPCDTPTILGRAEARRTGVLRMLEPGEIATRTLELEVTSLPAQG